MLAGRRQASVLHVKPTEGTAMADIETDVAQHYLSEAKHRLNESIRKIRHCVGQLSDEQLWWRPRPEMNSVANLILHVCGNVGQWIIAGVGGSPDVRDRPREFAERGPIPKCQLLDKLEQTRRQAEQVLERTTPETLLQRRRIQGFDITCLGAIFDSLTHLQGHTQEIVCLTRMQLGDAYRFDWVPKTPEEGAPG